MEKDKFLFVVSGAAGTGKDSVVKALREAHPEIEKIESYSYIKTYALYISYAGFFHLGYNDGMYLKYGGKKKIGRAHV